MNVAYIKHKALFGTLTMCELQRNLGFSIIPQSIVS